MTLYVRVENGVILEGPRRLPSHWGTHLNLATRSNERLAALGWLPVVREPVGDYQRTGGPVVEADQVRYPAIDIAIEDLADRLRAEMEQARETATSAGLRYTFDGVDDTIQLRPQDQENLTKIAVRAQSAIAAGEPGPIPFRALSNATYELTPEAATAMTDAAMTHGMAQYMRMWAAKDAIDALVAGYAAGDLSAVDARAQLLAVSW